MTPGCYRDVLKYLEFAKINDAIEFYTRKLDYVENFVFLSLYLHMLRGLCVKQKSGGCVYSAFLLFSCRNYHE